MIPFKVEVERRQSDEEELFKVLEPDSQEAIVSCLSLHWVNDLPGQFLRVSCLLQCNGQRYGSTM